ncbi:MAG: hypothetical protein LBG52_01700 [Candidatus Peribacteria bacterium]|jgi:hypothetical protein|nr:hypothetical protein [Candidatus Peribacteria bacterium]
MNTDTTLLSMVNEIYPVSAPENAGDTIITYSRIGENSHNQFITISLYQISIWCKDIVKGDETKHRLYELFNAWKTNEVKYCFIEETKDLWYKDLEEYGIHLTLRIKTIKP